MNKTFWAIIAVIILLFAGIVILSKDKASAPTTDAQPTNHVVGEGTSGVTLVEYGDFECSGCAAYYPVVEQVKEKYKDQITFQYRHLPLVQLHPNAFAASRAAEAAAKQGKFWEMYDLLFQNQQAWSTQSDATGTFEQYAGQLGLDVEKYKQDAASAEVNDIINADIAEFKKTGAQMSTPTFFLNGEQITPSGLEEFTKLIDEAIAKNQ
jgi:protein-disulfide isomerase